jgi:hypothetical protein
MQSCFYEGSDTLKIREKKKKKSKRRQIKGNKNKIDRRGTHDLEDTPHVL